MRLRVLIVAALLAGCGNEAPERPPAAEQADRFERVAAALDRARTLAGTVELSDTSAQPTLLSGEMRGTTDGKRSEIRGELTADGETTPVVFRQFGVDQYVKLTRGQRTLGPGKRWLRSEDATPTSSLPFSEIARAVPRNPDIVHRGRQVVGGVQTDHYSGPFDLAAMIRDLGETLPPGAAGLRTTLDLWIAEDDLPRRASIVVGPTTTVLEISEYGVPLELRRPPGRAVVDAEDLPGGG